MKQREEPHAMLMKNSTTVPHLMVYGYPHCKKPSDEDPCGLLPCWECSTSLLLAVQLPQAASAKITVVIGWDYVNCKGRSRADKERFKSSECDGNSSYTLLHRVPPLSP